MAEQFDMSAFGGGRLTVRQRARVFALTRKAWRERQDGDTAEDIAHSVAGQLENAEGFSAIPWEMIIELILKLIELFSKK